MNRKSARLLAGSLLVMIIMLSTGCQKTVDEVDNEITVFAASSLTEAVTDISRVFEQTHEGTDFKVNFAGSKTLRSQLENGASADIFLSADEKHYKALLDKGILKEGKRLLTNEMVLVVSKDAAQDIKSLQDLQEDHKLVLAEKGVPAGDYARKVISALSGLYGDAYEGNVLKNLASSESNVRQVLTKVVLGEGDAAIVYRTDITKDIAGKVVVIEIPEDWNVTASYWIGLVNKDMISENVYSGYEFFSEDKSREIFEIYGFGISE